MAIFKSHKLSLSEIICKIPDEHLTSLAESTKVDYCSKVLYGKLVFYLLIYGMLQVNKLSQRGLRDAFSSPLFRTLFNYGGKKEISHSSISERLSVIELSFFRKSYESIYEHFSSLYTKSEIAGMHLQRVDSTLVKESSNKLSEGLTCGNDHIKSKMLKYTINFDGTFASLGTAHKEERYASESLSIPENVMSHFKKEKDHSSVYVFDRGQSSGEAFKGMKNCEGLQFVGRLLENRKTKIVELLETQGIEFSHGKLNQDALAQIYKQVTDVNKNGKPIRKAVLVDEVFRIIRFTPLDRNEEIVLITNILNLSADEIASMYRRRWDIEVFFRFLKQELNFSHFLSLNENGIQVVLYMTMITAMLVMIYKKENELGYKTAIRRMGIELESLVLAIVVIQSGGDLKKTELPDP